MIPLSHTNGRLENLLAKAYRFPVTSLSSLKSKWINDQNRPPRNTFVPAGMTPPSEYPLHRDWSIDDFPLTAPGLAGAWSFSQRRLQEISTRLTEAQMPPEIVTVGIAGSLARMEATAQSDCDLVVVLRSDVEADSAEGSSAFKAVWEALEILNLDPPETEGIYSGPVSQRLLLDPATIGRVAEDQRAFGSRILFLLELQPVWGETAFRDLSRAIVERYADRYVALDPAKQWTYLLNDLVRYFKSLCQTYLFAELYDNQRWRLRNLKARHSRLLMYAGLLFLLGEASRVTVAKQPWLYERLTWTPLERLAACYAEYGDAQFETIAKALNQFVAASSDPGFRNSLTETLLPESSLARESNPQFLALKRNADDLIAELLRFALARRDDWADRFFEYWLF